MLRRGRTGGFTLTELLVVLAIIGILAGLLAVGVLRTKGRAQRIYCTNNTRQLGQAMQLFTADSHVYPLFINAGYWKGEYTGHFTSWNAALENEMSTHFPRPGWTEPKGVWDCPAAERPAEFPSDTGYVEYGYNGYGLGSGTDTNNLGLGSSRADSPSRWTPLAESDVSAPSDMIAIGDGFKGANGTVQDGVFSLWRTATAKEFLGSTRRSLSRHQGKANVVFCDGHVESPTLKFLFEDTTDAALVRWNRDDLPHRERL